MDNSVGARKVKSWMRTRTLANFVARDFDDEHQDIVLGEGVDSVLEARCKLTRRGDPVVEGRNTWKLQLGSTVAGPDETGSMLPTDVENFVVRNRM